MEGTARREPNATYDDEASAADISGQVEAELDEAGATICPPDEITWH